MNALRSRASVRPTFFALATLFAIILGALVGISLTPKTIDLATAEKSVFSSAGEDGVLERIFEVVKPRHRYLVDLGAGDGITGSSSRNLILNHGWGGLLVEPTIKAKALATASAPVPRARTAQSLIDPGDIEILLGQHDVPRDLDLLIVGLKGNDWHVWRAIQDFRPSVVQIQYNAAFLPPQRMVIEYHPFNFWDGSIYFGASIQSLYELGRRKGYELVYANQNGTNLFFVEKRLASRFSVPENPPVVLYHRHASLPMIPAATIWLHVDEDFRPRDGGGDLVVPEVRVPRRFRFDEL